MTALYAATASGLHVLGEGSRRELEARPVDAVHVSPAGERWAVLDRRELWRDAKSGWELVARSAELRLNCIAVQGDDVWVGASDARLLRLEDGSLAPSPSFDAAPGRDEWFTPWGGPPDVRSLALTDRHLFTNVHVGGILRAGRDGTAWEPTIEIASDVHEVVASDGSLAAATAWGLAVSADDGESWSFDKDGIHSSYARAVAVGEETLFMTASDGPFGGRAAIYRRRLQGTGFEKCEVGLPEWFDGNIDTGCVATSGSRVAFGTEDGRVFLSEDDGLHWEQIGDELEAVRWLEFDPH